MTSLAAGGAGVSGILNVMDASACSALHDEADELQWIADSYHEQANAAKSWADLNHLSHWNNRNQSMHRYPHLSRPPFLDCSPCLSEFVNSP